MLSLSSVTRRHKEPSYSYTHINTYTHTPTHTSCHDHRTLFCEVTTYMHPHEYHVRVSDVLQLFLATNEKNIKKVFCNSHEYFNIRLCSLGCDAVWFGRQ